MAGPSDLYDACAELLAACAEAVATTIGGAIGRAYVSPGAPPWDCPELLTVHSGGPAEADTAPLQPPLQPGHKHVAPGVVHLVELTITVLRCTPTLTQGAKLPKVEALEASARMVNEDVWAIWNHLRHRLRAGTLFPSSSGSREVMFDPAFPVVTQGGAAGWQIPLRVQLGGYKTPD